MKVLKKLAFYVKLIEEGPNKKNIESLDLTERGIFLGFDLKKYLQIFIKNNPNFFSVYIKVT